MDLLSRRSGQRSPLTKIELEREARISMNRKRMGERARPPALRAVDDAERLARSQTPGGAQPSSSHQSARGPRDWCAFGAHTAHQSLPFILPALRDLDGAAPSVPLPLTGPRGPPFPGPALVVRAEELGVLETARNLVAAINASKPQRTFRPKQPRVRWPPPTAAPRATRAARGSRCAPRHAPRLPRAAWRAARARHCSCSLPPHPRAAPRHAEAQPSRATTAPLPPPSAPPGAARLAPQEDPALGPHQGPPADGLCRGRKWP